MSICNVSNRTVSKWKLFSKLFSKLNVWVPFELKEIYFIKRIVDPSVVNFWNVNNLIHFWNALLLTMKNWLSTTMWSESNRGASTGPKHIKSRHPPEIGDAFNLVGLEGCGVFWVFTKEQLRSIRTCQQLDKLNKVIAEKRPELINRKRVVFHHDNA